MVEETPTAAAAEQEPGSPAAVAGRWQGAGKKVLVGVRLSNGLTTLRDQLGSDVYVDWTHLKTVKQLGQGALRAGWAWGPGHACGDAGRLQGRTRRGRAHSNGFSRGMTPCCLPTQEHLQPSPCANCPWTAVGPRLWPRSRSGLWLAGSAVSLPCLACVLPACSHSELQYTALSLSYACDLCSTVQDGAAIRPQRGGDFCAGGQAAAEAEQQVSARSSSPKLHTWPVACVRPQCALWAMPALCRAPAHGRHIVGFYGCGWSKESEEQGESAEAHQLFFLQVRAALCRAAG